MRGRLVKVLRQHLRMKGIAISAEPYTKTVYPNGMEQVFSSKGRQIYQQMKKEI